MRTTVKLPPALSLFHTERAQTLLWLAHFVAPNNCFVARENARNEAIL
jgi:hypothetical protein